MSVFQFIVNLIIAFVGCAIVGALLSEISLPLEGLIQLLLYIVVFVLTFSKNAAARLGVS